MILFTLITLSCISAADNNATAEIIAQDTGMNADEIVAQNNDINTEKILTDGETEIGNFSVLNTEIANSPTDTIQLTKNYTYDSEKDSDYTNGIVIDKADFTVDGQGHTIDGAGLARIFNITADNVTLKNINFINGCSESSGAIVYDGSGSLTITDCNFTNNKATTPDEDAGAIGFYGNTLTIRNSKFINNTANGEYSDGGAIYFFGDYLTITESEFNNNSAWTSGAIFAYGASATITNSRFENNKAKSEIGALLISTFYGFVDDCEFINNSAGFSILINLRGILTINNSIFSNNTGENGVNVIRNTMYTTCKISNCIFENNTDGKNNYSIDNNYGTLYLYNNTINTQTSEIHNYGGDILSPCKAIVLENKTIPVPLGEKTTLTAIITDDNGNLIEEAYYVYFIINDESIESTYNPKTSKYEAEYAFKTLGSVTINITCPSINITEVKQGTCDVIPNTYVDLVNELNNCQNNTLELTKDYIYDPINDSSYINGIVIDKANFIVDGQGHTIDGSGLARIFNITANNVTLKNINFIDGNGKTNGGSVCFNETGTVINCEFCENYAAYGGAIYTYSDVNVTDCKFIENSAEYGGAIWSGNNALITNSKFNKNNAINGGAIYSNNDVTVENCQFNQNDADNGGAIITYSGANVTNCEFIENAADNGGAILAMEEMFITNCKFNGNEADQGGAIFAGANAKIEDCKFYANNAEYGGAVYFVQDGTVTNCSFSINTAEKYGGSIYSNSILTVKDSKFTNNGAETGGAIYTNEYKSSILNSTFKYNAASEGGAIYNDGGRLDAIGCEFANNTAKYGGAIYNDLGEATILNTQFTNNKAERYGGAIDNEDGKTTIESTNFTQNTARYGGAIRGNYGEIIIENTQFTNNNATRYGGAIDNSCKATIDNSKFTANNATEGKAIRTEADMTISNSEFIGNGENCIDTKLGAKITLNNVSSDAPLVNDTISMTIIEAKDVVYGNDTNIKVQVTSSAISPLNSGKVAVKINGVEYTADVKDGIATLVIPKLDAGTYNVNVAYMDNNMPRAEIPVNFTVNKKDIAINAKNAAYVINYGGTYKMSFKNVANGTKVIFTLNGKKIGTSTIKNGAASIKLTAKILKTAKAGKKNMVIKIENSNYSPISKTVKITINKEKTKITAKAKTFKRTAKTKKYTITLKNSKNKVVKKAKVTLKVKGKTYTAKTNNKGKATFKITKLTKKGTYKSAIKYKGNKYYKKATKNIKIKIR